jgi:hypothetical protein
MKTGIIFLLISGMVMVAFEASAQISAPSPPGNIVQNGTFEGYNFSYWSSLKAIDGNANAPNGIYAQGGDVYQDLPTIPGQLYTLDFYAAADLYFGPSLTLEVALNSQSLASIITPPYTYNPGINRSDQMGWADYVYSFVGSANTMRLEFIDQNTYDFGLAAVSVVAVPEPATTVLILIAGAVTVYCSKRRRQV